MTDCFSVFFLHRMPALRAPGRVIRTKGGVPDATELTRL